MAKYSLHIKNAPAAAQRGAISIIEADTLETAIQFFARRKVLSESQFNKLFTVKLIK